MDLLPSRNTFNYYKGNLHGHSNHSDGALKPNEVVNEYKNLGYDFTCLSDHLWKNEDYANEKVLDSSQLNKNKFITITSAEIHCKGKKYIKDGLWHIVANGLPVDFKCANDEETAPALIQRAINSGAFVTIAHPAWYSLTFDECMSVSNAHGVEIYNHSCHIETVRGFGTVTADFLLQENKKIFLTATDDSHFNVPDAGGGWVMVAAKNLSEISILDSLKKGQFYSSTGVSLEKFEMENSIIKIECSPSNHITIVGKGSSCLSIHGTNITEAVFDLADFQSDWFRLTIIDNLGRYAWSNPIWL
jgi:histidinol phosphatase-like PHP family hydrolase|tara:strand:+ start:120 stop:1028 length:909 start_codon:yes stop_codon:yes gene_type:complete